jgi:signal transduction histidine kinase
MRRMARPPLGPTGAKIMDHTTIYSTVNRRILNAIGDPIVLVDARGIIVLSNRAARSAFALKENRHINSLQNVRDRLDFHAGDVLALLQVSGRRKTGVPDDIIHHALKDADGNELPIYLDVIHLSPDDREEQKIDSPGGTSSVSDAPGEARGADENRSALPGLRLMLDESVAESKRESGGLRLLRFRDLTAVQKSEKWRDELISMISHDIRNPLSAIRNSLSLLLTDVPDKLTPVQAKFVKTATRSIDRLNHLLDGVLDMSSIDSGNFKFNPSSVDVEKFVSEVMSTFETLFNVQRIRLKLKILGDIEHIYVDTEKLEQVLFNLLSNALKYTPDGGEITLAVRAAGVETFDDDLRLLPWTEMPNPKMVLITVGDTGLGMNEDTLSSLFTRHYKSSDEPKLKGSHVGLSISKALVEAQGGSLRVESRLGIGTDVTVSLPCDEGTGYVLNCIKSMKHYLDRFLSEGKRLTFYTIGKESSDCWINLSKRWAKLPVVNPPIDEELSERFIIWPLSEYLAAAILVDKAVVTDPIEQPEVDVKRIWEENPRPELPFGPDGMLDEYAVHYDGYTAGICIAPLEGETLARLFNLSLKRLSKADRIGTQSGVTS